MKIRRLLGPLVVLAVALAALPAAATTLTDPDDVPGKLDLATVSASKTDALAPLKIRITTYENWAARLLRESGRNRVIVLFNVDPDPKPEYRGVIVYSSGDLLLLISGQGSSFEPLPVRHPNGHTLRTILPGGSQPNPDGPVRLAVRSRLFDEADCSEGCFDRAPNGGWLTAP
jgi:hypothetical protein